jgi:hypothetical protein
MGKFRTEPDHVVLRRMDELAADERRAVSDAVACLAEVDRRKLWASLSYADLFDYCRRRLRYSTGAAYRRIHSARAAERWPEIYADLRDGTLSLCVAALIAPELRAGTAPALLEAARGKSKQEMEAWLAARRPAAPPAPERVKVRPPLKVPEDEEPRSFEASVPLPPPPAPSYEYAFTASARLHSAIERLKDLLWSKRPFGGLNDFLEVAIGDYLERHDPELRLKIGSAAIAPEGRSAGRRVPRRVRDAVWARDGGRCAFVSSEGRRCECRRALELDHIRPFSLGGRSDASTNIRLLCREHNQLERRLKLGKGSRVIPKIPPVETGG